MRPHAFFFAAAWIYFAYAVLFFLAVALGPWLTERKLTVGLVVVGCIVIGVVAGLGAWAWQVAQGRRKASPTFISSAVFPVVFGGLMPGFTASFIFGVPFTLVLWGARQMQLAESAQSEEAARDG